MSRLSWVQPEDLLAHEFVASAVEGRDVAAVHARWVAAGGRPEAPAGGASDPPASPEQRTLARQLLAEIDALPTDPELDLAEPSQWAEISARCRPTPRRPAPRPDVLLDRVLGGWLGRSAGCLLGKPVEKLPREGIREILQSTGRWPLREWFTARGLPAEVAARWSWNRRSAATSLAENLRGMPEDDDLNFTMLALSLLERHGPGFGTDDVADAWLTGLPGGRVFTAERVAYRNLLLGYTAPATATRQNPFREWIGAAIRTDVYGWANPGNPRAAAELAWRDARLSHTRSGIYGAMFVAAMCATALVGRSVEDALDAGLSVVPPDSRYAAAIRHGAALGRGTGSEEHCLDELYAAYGHLHWVHVLNNAALMSFALSRSRGDFGPAICTAVTGGWDTDSTAATVGSVCGALCGAAGLPAQWTAPLDRIASSVPGFDGIGFAELARRTVAVMAR